MALTEYTNIGFVKTRPTADPAGSDQALDTTVRATKYVAPANALRITELGWYCGNATEAASYDVAVYSHDAGSDKPNARIASVSTVTGLTNAKGTSAGWKYIYGLSIPVIGGTTYWISVQLDDTATTTNIDYTADAAYKSDYRSSVTACPDTWGASTGTSADKLAIYALYTYVEYNGVTQALSYIYQATSGGTVFGANQVANAVFDYFPDSPAANDAIYFGTKSGGNYVAYQQFSDLVFNVGTAMAGTDIVLAWEYYDGRTSSWVAMTETDDDTNAFTTTGSNRFKFPFQYYWKYLTLNSISNVCWVRCRLVSFTTVTEGGANQTSVVSSFTGNIHIKNQNASCEPSYLHEVITYMNTAYPHITSCRMENDYDLYFQNVGLQCDSPILTKLQTLHFGHGSDMSIGQEVYFLNYFTSGVLSSSNVGYDGSSIEWWTRTSWYIANTGTYTKLYGTKVYCKTLNPTPTAFGSAGGYIQCGGFTGYDCIFDSTVGYGGIFGTARTLTRVKFSSSTGSFIATSFAVQTWDLVTITSLANSLNYLYTGGGNFDKCIFLPVAGQAIFQPYLTTTAQTWYARNPKNPIPAQSANPVGFKITKGGPYEFTLSGCKVYFYDDSAGTYTDISAAIASATADDVPFYSDDPNDAWYFGMSSGSISYNFEITCGNAVNDNAYSMEVYLGAAGAGTWRSCSYADSTNNFTTSGFIAPKSPHTDWYNAQTINGFSARWVRMKCTTRGVQNPTLDKVRWSDTNATSDWLFYEQYSTVVKVVDQLGNPISGATVIFKDVLGTSTTLTTDASGLTTSTYFTSGKKNYDLTVAYATYWHIKDTTYNPYTITVTKTGYVTKKTPVTLNTPAYTEVIALENRREA